MKKVSVVIPAYNKAALTVKTVESVLGQTYKNIEVIVVDDGSTDDTAQRLLPYYGRIKYIHKENGGASSARNTGIQAATGEYVALLDCDDMFLPEKIERSVGHLEQRPDLGFVHTPVYFVNETGRRVRRYPFFGGGPTGWITGKLLKKNFICNSTVVTRRGCFEKAGYFDENIFTPADWDMWLRLSEHYKAGYIDAPLTLYRSSESYILNNLARSKKECMIVLEKAFQRNRGLRKDAFYSNIYFWQALGYLRADDYRKAKEELAEAIKKNKFNLQAWSFLIAVMLFRGKLSPALKRLKLI